MLDNHRIELAYAVVAAIKWIWALSQIKAAVIAPDWVWWPPTWRIATAMRVTVLALFFTFAGSIWWFDYFNPTVHEIALYMLAIVDTWVFIVWLRRRPPDDAPMEGRGS